MGRPRIKTLPAAKNDVTVAKALGGKWHWHTCVECDSVYACTYQDAADNGQCETCRTGRPRAPWETGRDPRPCCVDNTLLLTRNEDLVRYELAGPGPWFQCRTCKRSHRSPITTLGGTA